MSLTTIFALLLVGLLLCLLETVVPGGVLGIFGLMCLLGGIIGAFMNGATLGMGCLMTTVVLGGIFLWLWLKYLPKTSMGKKIILQRNGENEHGAIAKINLKKGDLGKAHTNLRPAGTAIFNDKRVDVRACGDSIEPGAEIKITKIEGNRITVIENIS